MKIKREQSLPVVDDHAIPLKEGDDVEKGQPIGLSGGTGRATGPHLHLAVRWQGVYLNPQVLLKLNLP